MHPFYTYSWGVNENLDLIILSEESYLDYHRYGLREEKYDNEKQKWVRINSIVKESEEDTDQKSLKEWTAGEESKWESEEEE